MIAGGGAPELGTPELFITELSDVIDIGSQSLERVQHDLYEKLTLSCDPTWLLRKPARTVA